MLREGTARPPWLSAFLPSPQPPYLLLTRARRAVGFGGSWPVGIAGGVARCFSSARRRPLRAHAVGGLVPLESNGLRRSPGRGTCRGAPGIALQGESGLHLSTQLERRASSPRLLSGALREVVRLARRVQGQMRHNGLRPRFATYSALPLSPPRQRAERPRWFPRRRNASERP